MEYFKIAFLVSSQMKCLYFASNTRQQWHFHVAQKVYKRGNHIACIRSTELYELWNPLWCFLWKLDQNKFYKEGNCALLGYYTANCGNLLPTFWDNLSTPSWPLKMGPIGCPETSARNYRYSLHNNTRAKFSSTLRRKPESRKLSSASCLHASLPSK